MLKKIILACLAGTGVIFIQAGLFFGYLFADFFANAIPPELVAVNKDAANFPLLLVADLLYAGLLSMLFEKFDILTFKRGAMVGATIGFFVVLHFDLIAAATTHLKTPPVIVLNVAISTLMSGIGGGTIGWVLGKIVISN